MEQEERVEHDLRSVLIEGVPEGLADLILLTLERKAWTLATQRRAARALLARLLAHHAEMCRNAERWSEAATLAQRALQLVSFTPETEDLVLRAGIVSAASLVYGGSRLAPEHGLHALSPLLARSTSPVFSAWIQSDMAKYLALSGQAAASLTLAEEARKTVLTTNRTEIYLRQMDNARLLLEAGQPDAALRVAPEPDVMSSGVVGQRQLAQDLLFHAQAQRLSHNIPAAQDYLRRGLDIIQAHSLDVLQVKADALAERL
jgi:hypothetical protein